MTLTTRREYERPVRRTRCTAMVLQVFCRLRCLYNSHSTIEQISSVLALSIYLGRLGQKPQPALDDWLDATTTFNFSALFFLPNMYSLIFHFVAF